MPYCPSCGTPEVDTDQGAMCPNIQCHRFMAPATRPPPCKGGRPVLPPDQRTVVTSVRLTPAQRDKLRALGPKWLPRKLNEEGA